MLYDETKKNLEKHPDECHHTTDVETEAQIWGVTCSGSNGETIKDLGIRPSLPTPSPGPFPQHFCGVRLLSSGGGDLAQDPGEILQD